MGKIKAGESQNVEYKESWHDKSTLDVWKTRSESWQTMLLSRWKGIFAWIPVETIVKEHQQEYYDVIAKCDAAGDSTDFIEFMLRCLLEAIKQSCL